MWNNLLKLTLLSYIWKRYRRTIISLPLLLIYFWIVNLIHGDVIAYATLKEDTTWLGWTFLAKWLFIFIGIGVFIYLHIAFKGADENTLSRSFQAVPKNNHTNEESPPAEPEDPFTRIRAKKNLRSKADVVLEKKK